MAGQHAQEWRKVQSVLTTPTRSDPDLLTRISHLIQADPGLPHPRPTPAFWQNPPHDLPTTATTLPARATTVVIGSGITACSLVRALLSKDQPEGAADDVVVVCEARGLTSGATGRNGGHLVSSAVADFAGLRDEFGAGMAAKVAGFTLRNVERMFEVVMDDRGEGLGEGVAEASELRAVDKVLALRDEGVVEKLRGSVEAFEEGMPGEWRGQMRMVGREELEEKYKLRHVAGGAIGKGGALWPYRLITRTWSHLLSQHPDRLRIETWTPVTSVTSSDEHDHDHDPTHPYLVTTPRGTIRATEVVYCTNGHTGHLLPRLRKRGALFPLRGTMTVQDCGPAFPKQGDSRTLSFYGSVKAVRRPRRQRKQQQTNNVSSANDTNISIDENENGNDIDSDDPNDSDSSSSSSDDPIFDLGLHYMQQHAATGAVFIGGETATAADLLTADDSRVSQTSLATLERVLPAEFADDVWDQALLPGRQQRGGGEAGGAGAGGAEGGGERGGEEGRQHHHPKVTSKWSGIMGFTADGVPLVGRLPEAATGRRNGGGGGGGGGGGEWIAAGFNGYGMGNCWLSGEALAGMMRGEDVSGWLPECYLATEERLASLHAGKAAERLFGC
ncbi:fad dependent oxidoreductase [Diplodia corticola]|uniref:Fad dependent oxidoreductase n=1 Tax=Diplodia corticola TaxID=236234 RepID=A0A1J9RNQ7_9PEZI|nr:fad dependent oxidoreductase [Diplodia corticola]OJD29221.1 fad dependent oxidoreductase [Diplodia corticola]